MATETTQPSPPTDWQELVARKRLECQEKIPRKWILSEEILKSVPKHLLEYDLPRRSGLMSDLELDVTENYTATELLVKLASGQVSSLVVTTAFSKRAAIAQQVVRTRSVPCPIYLHQLTLPAVIRHPVSQRPSSRKRWTELASLMITSSEKESQLALSMDYPSVSRTVSASRASSRRSVT